ncbi:hypothetical protein SAMN02745121_03479 [Nannocystis exedens]|uniref:Uncharacterized protein n=1 Tax=Nannocystis exedens TaxID=54 RepID=A0A1I1YSJ3_9BACT|nr:hypothetical protein [Nannocystis exedens]PCC70200.1 hypothetical protein NAEX_03233 [Nannocystis exedens]SFE21988.1 hypothetical protein SAMN02745121_03479 [Nannocystis exedens]
MSRIITRSLLLPVALVVPGCPLTPEIIGETVTTSGASGGSASATTDDDPGASTTTVPTGTTTSLPSGAYGSACALAGFPPIINHSAITPQPACDGGICLLVIDAKYQCESDLDCETNVGEGVACEEGYCDVSPAVILEEGSRCTQTCETVADCPEIPGCMSGAICSSFMVSGELCCQKVCGCIDSLYVSGVMSLQMLCDEMPDFTCPGS